MSKITSHVLDTALGQPATGVMVRLERLDPSGASHVLAERATDGDGRLRELTRDVLEPGLYRLHFETGPYFAASGRPSFFPSIEIAFYVDAADQHYHVPLLLSPFGYSTYRGS